MSKPSEDQSGAPHDEGAQGENRPVAADSAASSFANGDVEASDASIDEACVNESEMNDAAMDGAAMNDTRDIVTLQTELNETRERVLRLQAELENYRKRAQRTLEEERRYACLPLMRDLLPVVDNLQRGIDAAQQSDDATGLLEGVEMVVGQLSTILKQHHCEAIPAEGERFDPHLHEAIAQFPSDEHEPGDVTQVTQVGYQLHDRVVRPSQVIIAAPRPDAE